MFILFYLNSVQIHRFFASIPVEFIIDPNPGVSDIAEGHWNLTDFDISCKGHQDLFMITFR